MTLALIALVLGIICGAVPFYGSARLYKQKWEQATRVLQGFNPDELDKLLSPPTEKKQVGVAPTNMKVENKGVGGIPSSSAAMTPNKLLRLSNGTRVEIETARLRKGLPPMDPLTNLSNGATAEIMKERIRWGWG